jgi:putative SOS response-associated peptidase YedK
MCGRYAFKVRHQILLRLFPELAGMPFSELRARWNAAPTQFHPIIRASGIAVTPSSALKLETVEAMWGFVPSWAGTAKPGPINARCETAATNGMFRSAFQSRRCIVPVSGYYEWQERMLAPKLPLYITRADDEPMLLAGLWEKRGDLESFTIITVPAGGAITKIHDRTLAILEPGKDAYAWLNPSTPPEIAQAFLHPVPDGLLQWHGVSARVNSPANDDAGLITPTAD